MAHNIGQMFYWGDVPWHHLGKKIVQPATMEEALKEGGLNWTVSMMPLALKYETRSAVPQRLAIVRDDMLPGFDGRVLGVVHPNFKPLQNRDGAVLFDSLFGKGNPVYHTGGYLRNGEVVWLLARLPEGIKLADGDKLDSYVLFSNSHDGSLPIDIRLTTVRVVCNNTLSLALSQNELGQVFRRGHDGSYDVIKGAAETFFNTVLEQQKKTAAAMNRLANARCNDSAFADFLKCLLPTPSRPATASLNPSVAKGHDTRIATIAAERQQIIDMHLKGHKISGTQEIVIPPAEKTWWGGLNSITAWVDHVHEIDGDRYSDSLFGTGDRLKTDAYRRILALPEVAKQVAVVPG